MHIRSTAACIAAVAAATAAAHASVVTGGLAGSSSAFSSAAKRAQETSVSVSSSSGHLRARGRGLLLGHGLVLTAMDAVSVRAGTGEPLPLDDIEVAGLGDDAARPAALLVLIDGAGLALLRADAFADAPLPRYGNSTALDAGAPVYLASDSREGDPLVSGAVRGEIDRELSNATLRYVETTLPPDPALDGAPVFDANGEVIGVAAGRGSNGLVFLRIEDVRQVLRPIASAR